MTDESANNSLVEESVPTQVDDSSQDGLRLYDLPFDILVRIFECLDYKSLHKLSLANKKLYLFANDNYLWKKKLLNDIQKWRMIDSKTFPKEMYETDEQTPCEANVSFKRIYIECCPEILTRKDILKKLETFQQLHLTSTSEKLNLAGCIGCANPNFTLSSLSSLAMPIMVFGQIKDFVYRNVFNTPPVNENSRVLSSIHNEFALNKLIMFGPGLETTTSCLVTNILWKSEFKTIGNLNCYSAFFCNSFGGTYVFDPFSYTSKNRRNFKEFSQKIYYSI